jgi:hypothetical protein
MSKVTATLTNMVRGIRSPNSENQIPHRESQHGPATDGTLWGARSVFAHDRVPIAKTTEPTAGVEPDKVAIHQTDRLCEIREIGD